MIVEFANAWPVKKELPAFLFSSRSINTMPMPSRKFRCNHAYIDGANLHKGTMSLGWRVDYKKLYVWLKDKYRIKRAYIFLGYLPEFDRTYAKMSEAGFLVRFRDVTRDADNKIKGNCDTDMAVCSVRDVHESVFDKAVIVSGDGDFDCLIRYLQEKDKMAGILSPNKWCSILLLKTGAPIVYLDDFKEYVDFHR